MASGWAMGRTAAAARSLNSIGNDVDTESDRHESHAISSCADDRRNLNTTTCLRQWPAAVQEVFARR